MSKKSNTTIPHGTGKPSTHSTYTIHQSPEIHGEMPRFSNVPPPPSHHLRKNNMENNEYKEREMPQVSKMPPHPKKK